MEKLKLEIAYAPDGNDKWALCQMAAHLADNHTCSPAPTVTYNGLALAPHLGTPLHVAGNQE
jgi:hypothetical protein